MFFVVWKFIGNGDYFHQLHHAHFDCNYGANIVPLDKLFGTFISEKSDLKNIWKQKSKTVGMEANQKVCKVHPAGKRIANNNINNGGIINQDNKDKSQWIM